MPTCVCGDKYPLGETHVCLPAEERAIRDANLAEEKAAKRAAARGNRPAGTKGRSTVESDDRQDIAVAVRSLQRAHAMLERPLGRHERADMLAHVRLAARSLDDLLAREARRSR